MNYHLPSSLERLTSDTLRWIEGVLSRDDLAAPVILWSGGKDSMVMLHLIQFQLGVRLPVVLFREPWWPEKYTFHDDLISAWGLEVYSPPPVGSYAYQAADHLVLVARYGMRGEDLIDVPKDVVEWESGSGIQDSGFGCGAEILSRPKGLMQWPWDVAFIGHKDVDTDPVLGKIPLKADFVNRPAGTSWAYPLRHWTDANVWDYLEAMNVPMDVGRYDVAARTNHADRRRNSDWIHACTQCLTTSQADTCHCPKWNRPIPGRRENVAWMETLVRDHFNAPDFVGRGEERGAGSEGAAPPSTP